MRADRRPGVSADVLPLGAEMAQSLAYRYNLPLKDAHDLARVTEAAETKVSRLIVREELAEVIRSSGPPDFSAAGQPHAALARLPFDLYITASFDNILETALQQEAACRASKSSSVRKTATSALTPISRPKARSSSISTGMPRSQHRVHSRVAFCASCRCWCRVSEVLLPGSQCWSNSLTPPIVSWSRLSDLCKTCHDDC